MSRQLHLGAFLMGVGHHASAWRLADSQPGNLTSPAYYKALAQTAERGKFDYLFLPTVLPCPIATATTWMPACAT